MSTSVPTSESLKEKAKIIRQFLKEKCDVDISTGHSHEIISKVFGFKDWNTASALIKKKPKNEREQISGRIRTVGELKAALAPLNDEAYIDADYKFDLAEYLENLDMEDFTEGEVIQEFSFSVEKWADDLINLRLELDDETIGF